MTFIIILIKLNIPHYFNLQNKDELRVLISFFTLFLGVRQGGIGRWWEWNG